MMRFAWREPYLIETHVQLSLDWLIMGIPARTLQAPLF
jgi:hypothetical protein